MAEGARPGRISGELAQAVTRLGFLRRQIKELETEESLLRDRILAEISEWPRSSFPMAVGNFEVRLGDRKGRINPVAAYEVLSHERLLAELPSEPGIQNAGEVDSLGRGLAGLPMPEDTRSQLIARYKGAIEWHPLISPEALAAWHQQARLTPEQYRACFKDGKPTQVILTVR